MVKYYQKDLVEDVYLRDYDKRELFRALLVFVVQAALLISLFLFLRVNDLQRIAQAFNLSLLVAVVFSFLALMLFRIQRFWAVSIGQLLLFWGFIGGNYNLIQLIMLFIAVIISSLFLYQVFRLRNLWIAFLLILIPIVVIHLI